MPPALDDNVPAADGAAATAPVVAAAELERLRPLVTAILRRRYGRRVSAEDLFSQALLVTYTRLREGTLEDPQRAGGFLCGTAHRLAIAELRKTRTQATETGHELEIAEHSDAGGALDDFAHRARCADLVRRVLLQLPVARDREILVRFYLRGEDKQTLCQSLGLDDAHFNRVLHRARQRLGALLEAQGLSGSDLLLGGLLATTLGHGARLAGWS
jgi:RNA polymerase sigma-70 factor, ECF subfamily